MKRAAIYCRISRDPAKTELGVRRQEMECRALCEKHGIEIAEVLVDDDQSAYSGRTSKTRRVGYQRLLQLLSEGTINMVVAWHPDRLTRHPRELEDLIDALKSANATVRTVGTGEYDLATASGQTIARIIGAVAKGESQHKAERLRSKHDELARHGKVSGGGTRPYGYNADRVTINRAEAKILRDVAQRALAGASLRSVAVDLNKRGVPTVTGSPWTQHVLRRVLTSGRIAGLRIHRTGTFTAEWPAIIDADDHRRLVAVLAERGTRSSVTPSRRYLLTGGIAVCGVCGEKLVARPRADKRPAIVCATGPTFTGCGKIRALTEPVDALVTEAVLARLDSPALAAADTEDDDDTELLDELRRLDDRKIELGLAFAEGEIDRATLAAAQTRLEVNIAVLSERLRMTNTVGALDAFGGSSEALRASWDDLHIDQRRTIIASLVENVIIAPAVRGRNYFDPSRVSIRWKA